MSGNLGIQAWCLASTEKQEQQAHVHGDDGIDGIDRAAAQQRSQDESHDSSGPYSLADSTNKYQRTEEEEVEPEELQQTQLRTTSCVTEAQLSPDGAALITADFARKVSVYQFYSNESYQGEQRHLTPYSELTAPNPIWGLAVNPQWDSNDWNTTTVLVSCRDQYVGLHNAFWDASWHRSQQVAPDPLNISTAVMHYKLVNDNTEKITAPTSLAWHPEGNHFYAGQKNMIAVFDTTYASPITTLHTINCAGGHFGYKGQVSALSINSTASSSLYGTFAAGTRERKIGFYDGRSPQEVSHWELPGTIGGKRTGNESFDDFIGKGVSQLKWSPDGDYLYVAERQSDAILVYDMRYFTLALGHCVGRKATTAQKMGFDIGFRSKYDTESLFLRQGRGHAIWGGGTDGKVRVWHDPHTREGAIPPDGVLDVGDGPVNNVFLQSSQLALAVTSGEKELCAQREGKGNVLGGCVGPLCREWGRVDFLGMGDGREV